VVAVSGDVGMLRLGDYRMLDLLIIGFWWVARLVPFSGIGLYVVLQTLAKMSAGRQ
jgi:hypothetical protein